MYEGAVAGESGCSGSLKMQTGRNSAPQGQALRRPAARSSAAAGSAGWSHGAPGSQGAGGHRSTDLLTWMFGSDQETSGDLVTAGSLVPPAGFEPALPASGGRDPACALGRPSVLLSLFRNLVCHHRLCCALLHPRPIPRNRSDMALPLRGARPLRSMSESTAGSVSARLGR